jgi:hypothetical protein
MCLGGLAPTEDQKDQVWNEKKEFKKNNNTPKQQNKTMLQKKHCPLSRWKARSAQPRSLYQAFHSMCVGL